ncbi:MAG: nucleotidyltransferase domain-containing protein [Actinomycetota bacterium]|jgi:predicted nucleotidyltransferase|nr:nucleotidyltransferase domain-containing protein [Euzebyaceae bacterium]MDQ3451899.1 nucleotidyltransferase domain-containing protein [Actinomycetota bacterium]
MDQALVQRLRDAAPEAFDELPVVFAYLFGSRAAGRPRPDSDIDIALLLDDTVRDDDRLVTVHRCVDAVAAASGVGGLEAVALNDAALRFVGRVLRQRIVIFSRDEPARVAYESLLGRMADDVEVWAAPLDRALLAATAQRRR